MGEKPNIDQSHMLNTNYGGFAGKSKNGTDQTDSKYEDRDDLDTSLNRDPLSQAGITKMTGFHIKAS